MWVNTDTLISISHVNSDLSSALKIISQYGSAVIMKNNEPVYIGIDAALFGEEQLDEMPSILMSEATQNFSVLTYKIYDNGYVLLKKRKEPICVFYNFQMGAALGVSDTEQYIKEGTEQ